MMKTMHPSWQTDSEVIYTCPKPSAVDHLLTFSSSCHHLGEGSLFNAEKTCRDPFYLLVHMKSVYKMLDLKRQFKVRTTSRRAAPLGDPRGVPKLFQKCSSLMKYRIAYDKFRDILHLKFESSLRFLVVGVKAKLKIYKEIIDIDKMSEIVPEADLPTELLQFLSDFEATSDTPLTQFDNREIDEMLNNNDVSVFDDNAELTNIDFSSPPLTNPPEIQIHAPLLVTPAPEIIIPDSPLQILDHVWPLTSLPPQDLFLTPPPPPHEQLVCVRVPVIQQPQTFMLTHLNDKIMQPKATTEVVIDEKKADLQRRNNKASAEYRVRRRARRKQEEAEVRELEQRNMYLQKRVTVLEEVIKSMKDRYFDMIRGVKREAESDHHCCDKKSRFNFL